MAVLHVVAFVAVTRMHAADMCGSLAEGARAAGGSEAGAMLRPTDGASRQREIWHGDIRWSSAAQQVRQAACAAAGSAAAHSHARAKVVGARAARAQRVRRCRRQ